MTSGRNPAERRAAALHGPPQRDPPPPSAPRPAPSTPHRAPLTPVYPPFGCSRQPLPGKPGKPGRRRL